MFPRVAIDSDPLTDGW